MTSAQSTLACIPFYSNLTKYFGVFNVWPWARPVFPFWWQKRLDETHILGRLLTASGGIALLKHVPFGTAVEIERVHDDVDAFSLAEDIGMFLHYNGRPIADMATLSFPKRGPHGVQIKSRRGRKYVLVGRLGN